VTRPDGAPHRPRPGSAAATTAARRSPASGVARRSGGRFTASGDNRDPGMVPVATRPIPHPTRRVRGDSTANGLGATAPHPFAGDRLRICAAHHPSGLAWTLHTQSVEASSDPDYDPPMPTVATDGESRGLCGLSRHSSRRGPRSRTKNGRRRGSARAAERQRPRDVRRSDIDCGVAGRRLCVQSRGIQGSVAVRKGGRSPGRDQRWSDHVIRVRSVCASGGRFVALGRPRSLPLRNDPERLCIRRESSLGVVRPGACRVSAIPIGRRGATVDEGRGP